jgi:hypothetical protein
VLPQYEVYRIILPQHEVYKVPLPQNEIYIIAPPQNKVSEIVLPQNKALTFSEVLNLTLSGVFIFFCLQRECSKLLQPIVNCSILWKPLSNLGLKGSKHFISTLIHGGGKLCWTISVLLEFFQFNVSKKITSRIMFLKMVRYIEVCLLIYQHWQLQRNLLFYMTCTWWSGPLLHMTCTGQLWFLFQFSNRRTCT